MLPISLAQGRKAIYGLVHGKRDLALCPIEVKMSVSLLPLLSPSQAPWQLPMPAELSPLSSYGVRNPTGLVFPPPSGGNYQNQQINVYSLNASLAASLGYSTYFQAKASATLQFFVYEYIYYSALPMTDQSQFDPNGVVANLYGGYGFRIVLAFASASASASSSISEFAANVEVNGAALYANVSSLGFNEGSALAADIASIGDTFTAGSQFNVDAYASYKLALTKFIDDIADTGNASNISPVLVGADVNQAVIESMCGYDYPASVAYALWNINHGHTADDAVKAITTQKLPTSVPAIALNASVIYAIYAQVLSSSSTSLVPTSDQKDFAHQLVTLSS
ncbi:hypothetical protein [Vineibacter terrae]|uniref:hypothetical protein n=1 Tax=Vineibacter terrae TaxID=2586908 RepID=UPI002E301075|nr:hypothetical protein [Vineibacter terrae]HEX2888641.1 hypothetical protein [Vineibacter terrae]